MSKISQEKDVLLPSLHDTDVKIHGILRSNEHPDAALIVHGFNGRANGLLQYMIARDLDERGYNSFRINLCGPNINQRNIVDLSVATIAHDITSSIAFLRDQGAERIAFIGHSIGAMAVFYASLNPDIAVLWDPSHTDGYRVNEWSEYEMPGTYDETISAHVSGYGYGRIAPDSLFREQLESSTLAAKRFATPTLIVNAGKSEEMLKYGEQYAQAIPAQTTHVVDRHASHLFTENGAMERLFSITGDWLEATR